MCDSLEVYIHLEKVVCPYSPGILYSLLFFSTPQLHLPLIQVCVCLMYAHVLRFSEGISGTNRHRENASPSKRSMARLFATGRRPVISPTAAYRFFLLSRTEYKKMEAFGWTMSPCLSLRSRRVFVCRGGERFLFATGRVHSRTHTPSFPLAFLRFFFL